MSSSFPKGNGRFLNFGKYKRNSILEIYNEDPCYLMWVKNTVDLTDETKDIIHKILDVNCKHEIVEKKPTLSNPSLTWTCSVCKKVVADIKFDSCKYCKASKPVSTLNELGGSCWKCWKSLQQP